MLADSFSSGARSSSPNRVIVAAEESTIFTASSIVVVKVPWPFPRPSNDLHRQGLRALSLAGIENVDTVGSKHLVGRDGTEVFLQSLSDQQTVERSA